MQRMILAALATLALAACEGNSLPQAGELPENETELRLAADGLRIIDTVPEKGADPVQATLAFGVDRSATEAQVSALLGEPAETSSNPECGAGAMDFATYPSHLVLNYQDGKLVGWFLDGESPLKTNKGVQVGDALGNFVLLHRADPVEDSTLGVEYHAESGIGALMTAPGDAGRVEAMYAGTNCFFR